MNARLQDSLSGIMVIKSFAREDYEYDRFAREAEEVYDMRVNVIRMWTGFFRLITVSSGIGVYTVLAVGGWIHITNPASLSLGTLFAFAAYIGMFYQPVSNIARVNDTIQRALAAADRIFEVLHTEPDLVDAPDAIEMPPIKGAVTFENVSFAYSSGEEVLKDINLHAEPGQIIAIVGRSGAGKTSFVNLIPRFYDPTRGRVLIDGIDVRTVKQQSLRRQIGMVLQDTFLFNGTVRENLLYGKLDATEEEMIEAAKAAYADSFIREMPNGYDTEIGERGIKLSGGQKQRIAIARAILADPRIMILDEATSSVDSESEYYIHRAMDQLMQGRTTFVIAHRLSTIRHADIIVTLESGRVVEIGDHNTLMERNGTYSHLYEAQYRFEDELE
jgi:subfamily B ATP-binding cassette protein MsbA